MNASPLHPPITTHIHPHVHTCCIPIASPKHTHPYINIRVVPALGGGLTQGSIIYLCAVGNPDRDLCGQIEFRSEPEIGALGSLSSRCFVGNSIPQVFLDTGANTSSETMFPCRP